MRALLEISYRNVRKSADLDELIREKAEKLERVCNQLISCRVAVERPQQNARGGQLYRIRLDLRVPPGHELVVRRESGDLHDKLPRVLREAFLAAERQLKELLSRQRRVDHPVPGTLEASPVTAEAEEEVGLREL